MLGRLINYLRYEGLTTTFRRGLGKFFRQSKSSTVFLMLGELLDTPSFTNYLEVELLSDVNQSKFERIKFWDFVNTEEYIHSSFKSVLLLKLQGEYVGYAAETHETDRIVHGLGSFRLKKGQGWLGPVYIRKDFRGRGYNKFLLTEHIKRLRAIGVYEFFTSINSRNQSSLKSYMKLGFIEMGIVDSKGLIVKQVNKILSEQFVFSLNGR